MLGLFLGLLRDPTSVMSIIAKSIIPFACFGVLTIIQNGHFQTLKYKRDVYETLTSYICSFIHALVICTLSIIGIYSFEVTDTDELFSSNSAMFPIASCVTLGYFANDILYFASCIIRTKKVTRENMSFIVHHIVFSMIILWLNAKNKYHYLGFIVLLTELSTIIIDIFQYLRHRAKYFAGQYSNFKDNVQVVMMDHYNYWSYYAFFAFTLVFFETRFVAIIRMLCTFHKNVANEEPILFLMAAFVICLNGIWFKSIVNVIKEFKYVHKFVDKKIE